MDPFPSGMVEDIEEFFSTEHERGVGQDVYPGVFDTSFFPLQRKKELARMMQIARRVEPKVVYEIGADKGGGLYHWCKCLPTVQRVVACEIRGLPYADSFERAFPHLDFLWLPYSSYAPETVEAVREWLQGDNLDCLFIDGDKGGFLQDFEAYLSLMDPNGIVFLHDVRDPGPRGAYSEILSRGYEHEEILDISESLLAEEREEIGVPCNGPYEEWLRHWKGASASVGVIYLYG